VCGNIEIQWSFWNKLMCTPKDVIIRMGKGGILYTYDSIYFPNFYINEEYIVE
jgi:hypothetical protein